MDHWMWVKMIQHFDQRMTHHEVSLLTDYELSNIPLISVTLEVSQVETSWLKDDALLNMHLISVILEVSQDETS